MDFGVHQRGEALVVIPGLQLDSEGLHAKKKDEWEIDKPLFELKSSFESAQSLTRLKWSASSLTAGQKQKEILSSLK